MSRLSRSIMFYSEIRKPIPRTLNILRILQSDEFDHCFVTCAFWVHLMKQLLFNGSRDYKLLNTVVSFEPRNGFVVFIHPTTGILRQDSIARYAATKSFSPHREYLCKFWYGCRFFKVYFSPNVDFTLSSFIHFGPNVFANV